MSRKRTSLSAVLGPIASAEPKAKTGSETAPGATAGRAAAGTRRPGIKQQTAYLPEAVHEQLRLLAFEERRKMHSYIMEGLDLVFRARGLPSIDELTGTAGDRDE